MSYASKDSVEVHAQGVRGVHEMRDVAISYYSNRTDGKPPLFGISQFRRRKVVIKLVPEDTSRLFKGAPSIICS